MLLLLILATVSTPDLAALFTALGGILIGLLAAIRASKGDKASVKTTETNLILAGYAQIVKDLREEVVRLRKEYTDDANEWKVEREELLSRISILEQKALRRQKPLA